MRFVEEVSGAVAKFTLTTETPGATELISLRNYRNKGLTAAAYDCSGVYVETDF